MSAVERRNIPHAGRVISRIENGQQTAAVRHEAVSIIQKGILPEGSQLRDQILEDLTQSWRSLGSVEDSQLDTSYLPPSVADKDK